MKVKLGRLRGKNTGIHSRKSKNGRSQMERTHRAGKKFEAKKRPFDTDFHNLCAKRNVKRKASSIKEGTTFINKEFGTT